MSRSHNPPPLAQTVGYIGLGNAGYPLASTISRAGYHTIVKDANIQQTKRFVSEHSNSIAVLSNSDHELSLFNEADVLVTMLPNGEVVRSVLLDEKYGLARHLKNGAVVIDTSSSSPFDTRETGLLLQELNSTLTLIDSPITQEYAFALAKGDATLMVGCSNQTALDFALPVLKTMGKHVFVMGELGAGHAMKTLNNYTSAASILGVCDALVAGQKFGLDPGMMVDVMNVGTGVNFSTKESFRTDALPRRFASGYQLNLLLKDTKIARSVIESTGMQSALSDLIVESLSHADDVAGPEADHTECIRGWEKKFGIQLKQSPLPDS